MAAPGDRGAGADRGAPAADAAAVELCGIPLAHRIINASGTFDAIAARRAFGDELLERFPFAAFVSKTVTVEPRQGNPPPRLYEQAGGMINSIGLPNKGLRGYLAEDLPRLAELPVPLIVNVMGFTREEVGTLVAAFAEREEVAALELNVSCPNVKTGMVMGADPKETAQLLDAVRPRTPKPLIVKLTPNCASPADVAAAAEEHGADAVSLINTLRGMAFHPRRPGEPWLGGGTGGVSGPAVRAIALAQVAEVSARVTIPVVGMGGVQHGRHAADLRRAGADIVAVGTESFRDPLAAATVAAELIELEHNFPANSGVPAGPRTSAADPIAH
jgi:dihydroorotate dehydrogenase (NAD+) catalytic subunit